MTKASETLITGWSGFLGGEMLKLNPDFKLFHGDITREHDVVRNLRNVDTVLHFAALAYVPESWSTPEEYMQVNALGTLNFLKHHELFEKFVYISTSHVYGVQSQFPICEDMNIPNPVDPYSISKLAAENLVRTYSNIHGFRSLIIRPFNNFGPTQSRLFVIPRMCREFLKTGKITLHGDSKRNFLYVKDTVTAISKLLKLNCAGTVQIVDGNSVHLFDIAKLITPKVSILPTRRKGWDIDLEGCNCKFRSILPDFKFTPHEVALRETLSGIQHASGT